jgi:hypothetical protein
LFLPSGSPIDDMPFDSQLPSSLVAWRSPSRGLKGGEQMWKDIDEILRDEGYLQWPHDYFQLLRSPGLTYPLSSGFAYAIPSRSEPNGIGSIGKLREYEYTVCAVSCLFLPLSNAFEKNPLTRAARTREGHDIVLRVIVIGTGGRDHLKILKRIATGESSLLSNNHTLAMFAEFQFEDIIFGVFPKVGQGFQNAYDSWTKNSVGDIIEMLMQMLEVDSQFLI